MECISNIMRIIVWYNYVQLWKGNYLFFFFFQLERIWLLIFSYVDVPPHAFIKNIILGQVNLSELGIFSVLFYHLALQDKGMKASIKLVFVLHIPFKNSKLHLYEAYCWLQICARSSVVNCWFTKKYISSSANEKETSISVT